MEIICPRCRSSNVFSFWEKRKKDDWALCRNCFKRAPLYEFRIIEYPGFWDYLDDRIKEYKIDN